MDDLIFKGRQRAAAWVPAAVAAAADSSRDLAAATSRSSCAAAARPSATGATIEIEHLR